MKPPKVPHNMPSTLAARRGVRIGTGRDGACLVEGGSDRCVPTEVPTAVPAIVTLARRNADGAPGLPDVEQRNKEQNTAKLWRSTLESMPSAKRAHPGEHYRTCAPAAATRLSMRAC